MQCVGMALERTSMATRQPLPTSFCTTTLRGFNEKIFRGRDVDIIVGVPRAIELELWSNVFTLF